MTQWHVTKHRHQHVETLSLALVKTGCFQGNRWPGVPPGEGESVSGLHRRSLGDVGNEEVEDKIGTVGFSGGHLDQCSGDRVGQCMTVVPAVSEGVCV